MNKFMDHLTKYALSAVIAAIMGYLLLVLVALLGTAL